MAQTLKMPAFLTKLSKAIGDAMPGCEIEVEKVKGTNRYRMGVLWKGFPRTAVVRRQERVWKIARKVLTDEELLRVSMILTLRPDELAD